MKSISFSLRTRLILGNLIVTFLAVAGLGYYVYYRAQQENAYLTNQLNASILQRANETLTTTSSGEANLLDGYFDSLAQNVTSFGSATGRLLSNESAIYATYWNATQALNHLTNGSWDNPNSDVAAVFLPTKANLTDPLITELNTLRQLDFVAPAVLKSNPDVIAVYFAGVSGDIIYYPNVDLANQIPSDFDVTQRPWFLLASPIHDPSHRAVWSEPYQDAAHHGMVVSVSIPVYDTSGEFRGVAAMDIQLSRITQTISTTKIGQTGVIYLTDQNKKLIAWNLGDITSAPLTSLQQPGALSTALGYAIDGKNGVETAQLNGVQHFIAYYPISSTGYSLLISVPSQELLTITTATQVQIAQSARNTLIVSGLLILGVLFLSMLASFIISGALMAPLRSLTKTAEEIAAGNLDAIAKVDLQDEIGVLANTLNTMTATLRASIQSLEQRVKERTSALEVASQSADRRAKQFEAVAMVAKAINAIHQMDILLPQVASVISERFGYYHVGIFLNNESEQTAVLNASNSEGGQRLLARNHRLKIGEQGIVGYVAATGRVRVARNVGEDAVYFNNPDLPETLSEMALPLRVGDQTVGVLDVQSKQADAFSSEDIGILSILADEVSLAIDNTRLIEGTRRSLSEAEALYHQYLRQAWGRLPREEQLLGYRHTISGSSPLERLIDLDLNTNGKNNEERDTNRLIIPIKLRGELIGNLIIQTPQHRAWSQDELDLAQAVADRVALSVENARLFDQTSRRAERERMVTDITSKIRSTNNPEEMIEIALDELRSALGASQVQLIPQTVSVANDEEPIITSSGKKVDAGHNGNGAKK